MLADPIVGLSLQTIGIKHNHRIIFIVFIGLMRKKNTTDNGGLKNNFFWLTFFRIIIQKMLNQDLIFLKTNGIDAWNALQIKRDEEDIWADLTNADLHGMNLAGVNFNRAKLANADLRDADLSNAKLWHAELDGADLRGTNLIASDLRFASLRGAKLDETTRFHETVLEKVDFYAASLNKVNFDCCDLKRIKFVDADLQGAKLGSNPNPFAGSFVGANLTGADLSGSNLQGTIFCKDARIFPEMRSKQTTKLVRCNLKHCKLMGVSLKNLDMTYANLQGADLTDAKLQKANITGVDFRDATLSNAHMAGVKYARSKMHGRYLGIRGVEACIGNAIFRRDALDQDYIDLIKQNWRRSWRAGLFFLWGLIDYGRSLSRVFIVAVFFILLFGTIYAIFPNLLEATTNKTVLTPYYMSLKGFAFGDLQPTSIYGEIVVSLESVFGYLTLGLLVSVLAEKVARRS